MWWMECQTECELCSYKCITRPPNLPRCFMIAASSTKHKSGLDPKVMHDFTILSYPPIHFGGMGKWQKNVQNLYMNIEKIFLTHPPPGLAPFWGDIAHLPIFGGYWPILPSIMGKKWGDKSFMLLARIIYSPLPCGSIWSFFHGFRFIHLYPSYSCRSACKVLHEPNLSQLRASSKLIPTAWQQSSLSSSSDIQHIPRTIN